MVLEWYLGETCPLPEENSHPRFSAAFKDASGLKLVYQCLTQSCYQDAWTIFLCQQPAWDFYSRQLHFIKTPADGIAEVMRLTTGWCHDSHLLQMAQPGGANNFSELHWLVEGLDESADSFAETFFQYLLSCLSHRCATFTKFIAPPVLSDSDPLQQAALKQMKSDWKRLLLIECSEAPSACQLVQDLSLTFGAPERLMVQVFESASWNASQAPRAVQLLAQLVGGFADSKIVEDIHQTLRASTGAKANEQLRSSTVQTVLQSSDALEKRNLPHPAALSKEQFMALWGFSRTDFKPRVDFKAQLHRLPKEYSRIYGQKTWSTVSEVQLIRSAAGWAWLRYYLDQVLTILDFTNAAGWSFQQLSAARASVGVRQ
eukprot:s2135_g4.t1